MNEPLLFQKKFTSLSLPQRTALKVFFGCPLDTKDELDCWSVFQGGAIYNEIGQIVAIDSVPYVAREYERATMVVGRRGSKTDAFSSFVLAYEALCGGHKEHVGRNQDVVCLQVCQDLSTARANLRQFIVPTLESSPIGAKELQDSGGKLNVTAETARLRNGSLITVAPPTIKIRGQAIAACSMDELAFWAKADDSSNPDFEVERAVLPAMAQFQYRKLIKTSTPWTKEGILFRDYQIGTAGSKLPEYKRHSSHKKFLLLHATTLAMQNPRVDEGFIRDQLVHDSEAFSREYLAQFSDSITGFLNAALLREAITEGVSERPFDSKWLYIAALDPAFRSDAFAFTIGHYEPARGFVQDVIRHFKPIEGVPLQPAWVLDQLVPLCSAYGISTAYSDQFQLESLSQLAMDRGLFLERVQFTAASKSAIYGNLQQLLNQKRLFLLDFPAQLDELMKLERTLLSQGGVRISAPSGKHDDLATVAALCAYKAQGLTPSEGTSPNSDRTKGKTTEEAVWAFTSPKKVSPWWD